MFAIGNDLSLMRIQVRNSSLLIYNAIERNSASTTHYTSNLNNTETYSGNVTTHTKKRIERAVNLFLQISPVHWMYNPITKNKHQFQLSFITLTVSNDEEVINHDFAYKHLLKPFLTWMRDTKKINTYIWKAEIQLRGQIHYHITLNQFLHLNEIKEKWNYLQNKHNLLKHYSKNNLHTNPNSIDVHSVIKIKSIESYLCKYLSKHLTNTSEVYNHDCKEKRLVKEIVHGNILSCAPANYFDDYTVQGKVWDCSTNLKGKRYYTLHAEKASLINLKNHLENNEWKEYTNDFCLIVTTNDKLKNDVMTKAQKTNYDNYIASLKDATFKEEKKPKGWFKQPHKTQSQLINELHKK